MFHSVDRAAGRPKSSFANRVRAQASGATDDAGIALVAVIGVLAIALVLSVVIASSVVAALGVTTSTRAGVQSQAAAEAGIAAARAGLIAGCSNGGVYASAPGTQPEYLAKVYVGSATTPACPGLGQVARIVSTGSAASPGINGASGRDVTAIEAVLSMVTVSSGIEASGPAIYAYKSDGFAGSGTLVSVDGSSPSVMVRKGNIVCNGGSSGLADWVIQEGTFEVSGSCTVRGNAWAMLGARVTGGGLVTGNLTAESVYLEAKVQGNVWSRSSLQLSGGSARIDKSAYATSLRATGSASIGQNAFIRGAAYLRESSIGGNLTARNLDRAGGSLGSQTITGTDPGAYPVTAPPQPVVPNWVDFDFDPSDWEGFLIETITGTCDYTKLTATITRFGGQPGVIDARLCTNPIAVSSYQKLEFSNDLAIVANRFTLGGSGGFRSTAGTKRLWLINPDIVKNGEPTCPGQMQIDGGFTFQSVRTMVYTGCHATLASGLNVTGQLYAGSATVAGAATVGYAPVGLPGVDLNTGEELGSSGTEVDRTLVSQRNIEVG